MKRILVFITVIVQFQAFAFFDLGTPNKSCPNGQITVGFTTDETFTNGLTTFTCLISDQTGSFAAPQSVVATLLGSNFVIPALPSGLIAGTNYRIKIQANNPSVLSTQSAAFEVVAFPVTPLFTPLNTTSNPLEVCVNSPTTFNISNIQGGVSYKWGWNFGFTGDVGSSLTRNNNLGGNFHYWVEAYKTGTESVCEGIRSDYSYIKVNDLSPYAQTQPDVPFSQCPGGDALIAYSPLYGADTYTYQWLKDGININGETNASINPTVSGSYSLKISKAGCSGSSVPIDVTFAGSPISASFIVPPSAGIMCLNTTLTANPIVGATYEWHRYGSWVHSGQSFSPTDVFLIGDYQLKVINGTCFATTSFKLIPPPNEVLFYATLDNQAAGTPIDLVVDILNVDGGNWSYQIADCPTVFYNISNKNSVGQYSVTPTANSTTYYLSNISNACGATTEIKSLTVTTTAPPSLSIPSVLNPCSALRVFSATTLINSASLILPGSRIRFESGSGIVLTPGFGTEGTFEARIVP